MKKFLSILLVLCMLIGMLPMTVLAEETEEPEEPPAITSTLTVSTGTNENLAQWKPALSAGMAPAYAKTSAEGIITEDGASESDYNLKVEWAADGTPTLTLKGATLTNNNANISGIGSTRYNTIAIGGTEAFVVKLQGTNVINGVPANTSTTTTAYRCPMGIYATNAGTLTIQGASQADSLTIDNKGGHGIDKRKNALTIENCTFAFKAVNTKSAPQIGIVLQYEVAANADLTNLTVRNAALNIEPGKYLGNMAILLTDTGDRVAAANVNKNTGDVLFQNSSIRFYRSNGTGSTQVTSSVISVGSASTLTIDRCDVHIYGRHIIARYAPTILNATATFKPEGGEEGAWDKTAGDYIGTTKITTFKTTHICGTAADDFDCTTAAACDMCGEPVAATQGHIQAADDGDCTTDILCANSGCAYVFVAGNATHTPAADDNDCTTATHCTVCNKVLIPALSHTLDSGVGCADVAYCTVCGKALQPTAHTGGTATCQTLAVCAVCNQPYGALNGHIYTNDQDTSCDNLGCNHIRVLPSVDLTVTTGDNNTPITWRLELYEGMTPVYAKTSAEGSLILVGASESDYNLKAEWTTGGKPTLILKNATLTNDNIYPKKRDTIAIGGSMDFIIALKGANTIIGSPFSESETNAAYRYPTGIFGGNRGSLTIRGESKADSLTIDNKCGNGIEKRYNALTIEDSSVTIKGTNAKNNSQHGIVLQYIDAGLEDMTDLTVRNAALNIEPGKYHSNIAILLTDTSSAAATNVNRNTGDILFKNSEIRLLRSNSTGSTQSTSSLVALGSASTFTIDRCDVHIYGRHIVARYAPTIINATATFKPEGGEEGAWDKTAGDYIGNTKITTFKTTHICGTDDCTVGGSCSMCGEPVAATQGHIQAADDGDCTTDILCANSGCAYVFVAGNATHTPAADDGDCTTAIRCTICGTETTAANQSHIQAADDGDCTTAIRCTICGIETTAATQNHIQAADDGDCTTDILCANPGCAYVFVAGNATHTPAADDGDCTTAIRCTICGIETTAATAAHTGGAATCIRKAVCTVCNKEYGELAPHTPAARPNCDVAANCTVCGQEVLKAGEHVGGTATCTQQAICENCGVAYGALDSNNHTGIPSVSVQNDTDFPFTYADGKYTSTNKSHSSVATLTITTQAATTINVTINCSTEQKYDEAIIAKNGIAIISCSGTASITQSVVIAAGDVLTIQYSKDGSVSSGNDSITVELSGANTEATCTDSVVCSDCGAVVSQAMGHSYLTNDNDATNPFILVDGKYTSTNKANNSSSTYTYTAGCALKVSVEYTVSSEPSYDKLLILKNNAILYSYSGEQSGTLEITLDAGDTLMFRYNKDNSNNRGNDCAAFAITAVAALDPCTQSLTCTTCGLVVPATGHTHSGRESCDVTVYCTVCGNIALQSSSHSYTDDLDTTCNNVGCTHVRVLPTAYLTVATGDNNTPIIWSPELYEGMTPVYAKTTAEGSLVLEGASESDYNLKAEWPAGGKPTLILKNATLVNNTYYVDSANPAKPFIAISGVEDFEIIVKGTNVFNGRHDTKPLTTAAYRSPTGIKAQNEGTLVIKGESKADSWTIDNYSGVIIEKYYNSLTIENVTFAGYVHNTGTNSQFGISMIAYKEACLDKTDLIIKNADFTIEDKGNKYHGNILILLCGTKSNTYSATNTSDILFQNSKIRIYRNNSSASSQEGSTTIKTGENSTITIDRCDVLVFARHRTFNYWPALKNVTVVTAGEGVLAPGTKINSSTLPKLELTHTCGTGDCTIGGTCSMCGKPVAATQGHVQAPDDGDCTTDILCANPGCAYVFVAGNAAHTPAADDNDCTTATHCTVCNKVLIPAPGHTPGSRVSCADAAYCTVCGKVALQPTAHIGGVATCQALAACAVCNQPYGEIGSHTGGTATCQARAVCVVCNQPYGVFGSHSYLDEQDTTCNNPGCTHVRGSLIASGTCGENLTWTLERNGLLAISGTGSMYNYSYSSNAPWYSYYSSIQSLVIEKGVTTIGDYAFYYCTSLTSVTIGDGVTTIGNYAFRECSSLTSVTILDSVTTIGDYAFVVCSSLTSVTIGDSVTSIGSYAFSGCSSLTSITIPDSVTTIGSSAFSYCSSLTSVTIPDSVTTIGNSAFEGCTNLTDVYITDPSAWCKISSIEASCLMYHTDYLHILDTNGNEATEVVLDNTVTMIPGGAFLNCLNLTCITIPNSVTTIGFESFSGCTALTRITIPNSITEISACAFEECTSLTTVYYCGTQDQWDAISISPYNTALTDATLQLHNYENGVCTICGHRLAYTVTFKNWDGTVLSTETYYYGDAVTAPAAPTKAEDDTYTYTFAGWDREVVNCEGDATYTATFVAEEKDLPVQDTDPQIFVESKKVVKGSTFTVNVWVKNNPGFSYLEMTPVIAPELTLVDVANGQLIADFTTGNQYVWVAEGDMTADGVLMRFTFRVDNTVALGTYQIGFQVRTCGNDAEETVELAVVAADIEVIDYAYGDATGDGLVDGFDVIRLKKYLANYNYDTETSTIEIADGADATGDGVVDGFDVIRLKKYLANFNYDTGTSTIPLGPQ